MVLSPRSAAHVDAATFAAQAKNADLQHSSRWQCSSGLFDQNGPETEIFT